MNALILALALLPAVPPCDDCKLGWQEGYTWHQLLPPAKAYSWQIVPLDLIKTVCTKGRPVPANVVYHACAQWGREVCVIFAPEPEDQTPRWLRRHELLRHCNGQFHEEP